LNHIPFESARGDFDDPGSLEKAVTGVDYVYHVAGVTKAKTAEEYFRGNHLATANILAATEAVNPKLRRFVHVSSQTVVGPSGGGIPVDESTPLHPITTYGRSKMEAEKECLKYAGRLPITIARPPAVYGQRDTDVFEFFNTMKKGLQPMVGFGDKYVSLIHVTDLVRGIIMAGEHQAAIGQTYFISSSRFYNWKEVGDITARIMGKRALRIRIPEWGVYAVAAVAELAGLFSKKPTLLNFEKARDMVQDAWTCDASKARRDVGFEQQIQLEEGIRETVAWYKQEGWL
jgi:nucleoside-diphosphate-sugar epimerase